MGEDTTPPSPGFTPADLERIGRVMERRLGATLVRTERKTSREKDLIKVWVAGSEEHVYRIERDSTGYCYIVYCAENNWKLLECGTLDNCLVWYE